MKDIKSTQSVNESSEVPTNTRRQFFKKAAIGSALLTTVSSRPVWAVGCTVSGEMSGNLSNPDRNDCDAAATGKSPGYWKDWAKIFDFFVNNPSISWANLTNNQMNLFKLNGEGQPINVLYNWIIAADNSAGKILYPAINGIKTVMGGVLSDPGFHYDFNYSGALLSVAHPNILFPYPSNTWTLQYLIDNYESTDTHDDTHELVADFFGNNGHPVHLEPSPGLPLFTGTEEDAFIWAKGILGF
jgi:hypothetical protein